MVFTEVTAAETVLTKEESTESSFEVAASTAKTLIVLTLNSKAETVLDNALSAETLSTTSTDKAAEAALTAAEMDDAVADKALTVTDKALSAALVTDNSLLVAASSATTLTALTVADKADTVTDKALNTARSTLTVSDNAETVVDNALCAELRLDNEALVTDKAEIAPLAPEATEVPAPPTPLFADTLLDKAS